MRFGDKSTPYIPVEILQQFIKTDARETNVDYTNYQK